MKRIKDTVVKAAGSPLKKLFLDTARKAPGGPFRLVLISSVPYCPKNIRKENHQDYYL